MLQRFISPALLLRGVLRRAVVAAGGLCVLQTLRLIKPRRLQLRAHVGDLLVGICHPGLGGLSFVCLLTVFLCAARQIVRVFLDVCQSSNGFCRRLRFVQLCHCLTKIFCLLRVLLRSRHTERPVGRVLPALDAGVTLCAADRCTRLAFFLLYRLLRLARQVMELVVIFNLCFDVAGMFLKTLRSFIDIAEKLFDAFPVTKHGPGIIRVDADRIQPVFQPRHHPDALIKLALYVVNAAGHEILTHTLIDRRHPLIEGVKVVRKPLQLVSGQVGDLAGSRVFVPEFGLAFGILIYIVRNVVQQALAHGIAAVRIQRQCIMFQPCIQTLLLRGRIAGQRFL